MKGEKEEILNLEPSYSHRHFKKRGGEEEPIIHKRKRDSFLRDKIDYDRRGYLGGGRQLWKWVVGGSWGGLGSDS